MKNGVCILWCNSFFGDKCGTPVRTDKDPAYEDDVHGDDDMHAYAVPEEAVSKDSSAQQTGAGTGTQGEATERNVGASLLQAQISEENVGFSSKRQFNEVIVGTSPQFMEGNVETNSQEHFIEGNVGTTQTEIAHKLSWLGEPHPGTDKDPAYEDDVQGDDEMHAYAVPEGVVSKDSSAQQTGAGTGTQGEVTEGNVGASLLQAQISEENVGVSSKRQFNEMIVGTSPQFIEGNVETNSQEHFIEGNVGTSQTDIADKLSGLGEPHPAVCLPVVHDPGIGFITVIKNYERKVDHRFGRKIKKVVLLPDLSSNELVPTVEMFYKCFGRDVDTFVLYFHMDTEKEMKKYIKDGKRNRYDGRQKAFHVLSRRYHNKLLVINNKAFKDVKERMVCNILTAIDEAKAKSATQFFQNRLTRRIEERALADYYLSNGFGSKVFTEDVNIPEHKQGFICLEIRIDELRVLKYSLETIKGIQTICEQDFPNATPLLGDNLNKVLSETCISIYTTEEFHYGFEHVSKVIARCLSPNDVFERINNAQQLALIVIDLTVIDDYLLKSFVDTLTTSTIHNTGVLKIGRNSEEGPFLPNVFFSHTQSRHNIVKCADLLLERCAFGILKAVHQNLQRFEEENIIVEKEKDNLQDVYHMIKASFKRRRIPKSEWPDTQTEQLNSPMDKDKEVSSIIGMPGIIGYVKKRGMLHIYIDSSKTDVEDNFRRELQKQTEYDATQVYFVRRTPIKLCSSGDSVCDERGTLGGFVMKRLNLPTVSVKDASLVSRAAAATCSSMSNGTLAALVSRHTVQGCEFLTVDINRKQVGRIVPVNADVGNDILPVDVSEGFRHSCVTKFKTEEGVVMHATKLRTLGEMEDLDGAPVHIWSKRSGPGLGILLRHDFINGENSQRILVRDRRNGRPFAQGGDSGAMVCYYDPDVGMLYAVAMVVEIMLPDVMRQNREYTAQIVDYALQNLSIQNDCEYSFIEDDGF